MDEHTSPLILSSLFLSCFSFYSLLRSSLVFLMRWQFFLEGPYPSEPVLHVFLIVKINRLKCIVHIDQGHESFT